MSTDGLMTTDDPKSGWHSLLINNPGHTSKQDRPEREAIAFATGFEMYAEPSKAEDFGPVFQWIIKCLLPVLIVLSMTANIIIILVMHHISQWKFPPTMYIVILSMIDLSLNTLKLLDSWCQVVFKVRFLNSLSLTSEAVCSSMTISMYFLYHLASLIRSALCIDVYYAYKCPLASTKKVIVCRIEHFILLFVSILLIFNSHFLWTYSVIHMNTRQNLVPAGNYCTYMVKWVSPTFRDVVWPTVDIFIGELCPLFSVLISTTFIAVISFNNLYPVLHSQLDKYMIDVEAFIEMRRFLLFYNIASFVMILVPSVVSYLYKGLTFQKNHAMKMVTTFSTARSSTRTYINPTDISMLNITNQSLSIMFPIVILFCGWCFSRKGFRKELLFLAVTAKVVPEVNFSI